jgi:hypothetical protein
LAAQQALDLIVFKNSAGSGLFLGFHTPAQKLVGTALCSLSPRALNAYIRLAVRKTGYGDKRTSE